MSQEMLPYNALTQFCNSGFMGDENIASTW